MDTIEILEAPSSSPDRREVTGRYIVVFPQYIQANATVLRQNRLRQIPTLPLLTHHNHNLPGTNAAQLTQPPTNQPTNQPTNHSASNYVIN
jgi:hypothetical protein